MAQTGIDDSTFVLLNQSHIGIAAPGGAPRCGEDGRPASRARRQGPARVTPRAFVHSGGGRNGRLALASGPVQTRIHNVRLPGAIPPTVPETDQELLYPKTGAPGSLSAADALIRLALSNGGHVFACIDDHGTPDPSLEAAVMEMMVEAKGTEAEVCNALVEHATTSGFTARLYLGGEATIVQITRMPRHQAMASRRQPGFGTA